MSWAFPDCVACVILSHDIHPNSNQHGSTKSNFSPSDWVHVDFLKPYVLQEHPSNLFKKIIKWYSCIGTC